MKFVAISILALAAAVVAHPFVANGLEKGENASLAALCWTEGSIDLAKGMLTTKAIDDLYASVERDAPDIKVTRDAIAKKLSTKLQYTSASTVNRATGGAECNGQFEVALNDAKASGIINFTVSRSAEGHSASVSFAELSPILMRLNFALNRAPQ